MGRHSCIAQGASPGLIVSTHLLSLNGAVLPQQLQRQERKATNRNDTKQMLTLLVPLLRSSFYFWPYVPRVPFRALPSLHPGLCRSVVPTALVIKKEASSYFS